MEEYMSASMCGRVGVMYDVDKDDLVEVGKLGIN